METARGGCFTKSGNLILLLRNKKSKKFFKLLLSEKKKKSFLPIEHDQHHISIFPFFCRFISELVSGTNMQGISERYQAVLDILVNKKCSLTKAMRRFGILRNTLRDYVGICELRLINTKTRSAAHFHKFLLFFCKMMDLTKI